MGKERRFRLATRKKANDENSLYSILANGLDLENWPLLEGDFARSNEMYCLCMMWRSLHVRQLLSATELEVDLIHLRRRDEFERDVILSDVQTNRYVMGLDYDCEPSIIFKDEPIKSKISIETDG